MKNNSLWTDAEINWYHCLEGKMIDLHFSCFYVGKRHHQCTYVVTDSCVVNTTAHADRLVMSGHTNLIRSLANNSSDSMFE